MLHFSNLFSRSITRNFFRLREITLREKFGYNYMCNLIIINITAIVFGANSVYIFV